MARLFDQFLVIYNNENLPNNIHNLVSRFKFYQKLKKSEIINPNSCKMLPKCEILSHLVTLILNHEVIS